MEALETREALEEHCEQLELSLEREINLKDKLKSELNLQKKKNVRLSTEVRRLEAESEDLEEELAQKETPEESTEKFEKEFTQAKRELGRVKNRSSQLAGNLQESRKKNKKLAEDNRKLKTQCVQAKSDLKEANKLYNEYNTARDEEITDLLKKKTELEKDLADALELIEMLKNGSFQQSSAIEQPKKKKRRRRRRKRKQEKDEENVPGQVVEQSEAHLERMIEPTNTHPREELTLQELERSTVEISENFATPLQKRPAPNSQSQTRKPPFTGRRRLRWEMAQHMNTDQEILQKPSEEYEPRAPFVHRSSAPVFLPRTEKPPPGMKKPPLKVAYQNITDHRQFEALLELEKIKKQEQIPYQTSPQQQEYGTIPYQISPQQQDYDDVPNFV